VWGTSALVVREGGARLIETDGRVAWAAPASGDRAVLMAAADDGMRLEIWEEGASEPSAVQGVGAVGPIALTGYSRQLVLVEGDEGRELVERDLPDLEPVERLHLDRAPIVLATSPSEHRLFAAGAERIVTIDRYGWRSLARSAVPGTVREIRPAVTGDLVLVFDGSATWAIPPDDADPVEVEGRWRTDLPLGLPGGRVLAVTDAGLRLLDLDGQAPSAVDGPVDAWWVPVRWTPRRVEPVVRPPAQDSVPVADSAAAESEPALSIGLTTIGRVAGRTVADPGGVAGGPRPSEGGLSGAAPDPFSSIPGGFYAVASSSRTLETVRQLQRALERSGYPTEVLARRDEANELWYRLMVGPYSSRDQAEAAASSLQRERGISAWIHEAIGDLGTGQP